MIQIDNKDLMIATFEVVGWDWSPEEEVQSSVTGQA